MMQWVEGAVDSGVAAATQGGVCSLEYLAAPPRASMRGIGMPWQVYRPAG